MKLYLAGMGVDEKALYKVAKKANRTYRRLVSYAYKADTIRLLDPNRKRNEKKRTVKRVRKSKIRNSK